MLKSLSLYCARRPPVLFSFVTPRLHGNVWCLLFCVPPLSFDDAPTPTSAAELCSASALTYCNFRRRVTLCSRYNLEWVDLKVIARQEARHCNRHICKFLIHLQDSVYCEYFCSAVEHVYFLIQDFRTSAWLEEKCV